MRLKLSKTHKLSEGKVFLTTLRKNKRFFSLRLPKKIGEYLGINGTNKIYWTALDNSIQLTSSNPKVGIPIFEFKKTKFIEQE